MLEDLKPPTRSYPCRVRDLAATLEPKDEKIMLAAAEDPAWSIIGLSRELSRRGLQISEQPLKSHRSRVCSCFRA
jgi:hypothetical protein